MSELSNKEIDLFSQKILEDYDAKNPGTIFKDKININNGVLIKIHFGMNEMGSDLCL